MLATRMPKYWLTASRRTRTSSGSPAGRSQEYYKGQWSFGGELPGSINDELFDSRIEILLANWSRVNGIKELRRFHKVDLDDLASR
jgi:hypothetical protein